ncbi:hypothetical protein P3T18_006467 [Paraburkholderia sp. GAS199]|uniref:hypothetical protein n=1 Tax=Paraburkholderia sp. GAS199 TaxID=3035126 RepID=UPI003D1B5BDD
MIRKTMATLVLLGGMLGAQFAIAQTSPLPQLGFKLGDDVATVKAALKTSADVEPMPRNPLLPTNVPDMNKGKSILHLRTKGIWVFFNAAGTAETIRLDAPFSGDVMGVTIGEDIKKVTAKLGNPISKPNTILTMQTYRYVLDDSAYVTFNANDDGVQVIFITK